MSESPFFAPPACLPGTIPFILLGHPRSGSNLVMYSLMEHPKVAMTGELFHLAENVRRDIEAGGEPFYSPDEDGAGFLSERVFAPHPDERYLARGFKMFYKHARSGPSRTAWDYLIANRAIRVVHLIRRNLMECRISLEIATRTGRWEHSRDSGPAEPVAPFTISPEHCHEYFNELTASQLWASKAFAGHSVLELEYEKDVRVDLGKAIARIYEFLNVPPGPAPVRLLKQQTRRSSDLILNFDECRDYFRHTLFESFFDAPGDETKEVATQVKEAPQSSSRIRGPSANPERATRFVLLCHARTGSNLVLWSLDTHPEIWALGEVLTDDEKTRAKLALDEPGPRPCYHKGEDGAQFLDQHVFLERPPGPIRACGFKMFYEYARWDRNMNTAWEYLRDNADIRIIHLTRFNLLDCIISHKVAHTTGQWFSENEEEKPKKEAEAFWLDAEECHAYFDRIMTWRAWVAEAMKHHPMLEVEYQQDLTGNFHSTMARIFDFLGVSRQTAGMRLRKQQTKPRHEQLLNFEELRAHFRYTIYEEFFENGPRA